MRRWPVNATALATATALRRWLVSATASVVQLLLLWLPPARPLQTLQTATRWLLSATGLLLLVQQRLLRAAAVWPPPRGAVRPRWAGLLVLLALRVQLLLLLLLHLQRGQSAARPFSPTS